MKLKVTYTTQLKAVLPAGQEEIELPVGAGLTELLQALAERYPDDFPRLALRGPGQLAPSVLVCVNDEQVPSDSSPSFADGDHITLLSAISGG